MHTIREQLRRHIPRAVFVAIQPWYHFALSFLSALRYRFPSREIIVIGVTGTKGKSSVVEIINAILEEAGLKTALTGTIRFKIADREEPNLHKMTMPGRSFVQKFLRDAVSAGCTHAILEMTSEGVKQYRHKFIALDALIFTNIAPEHIESHGSFEKYLAAKLELAKALEHSSKSRRAMIANVDDEHGTDFLAINVEHKIPYSLKDLGLYTLHEEGATIMVANETIRTPLTGVFNVYNMLAAIALAQHLRIPLPTVQRALENLKPIAGRVERIECGQDFSVIVDYAHTPDSLKALYEAFKEKRKICVLGNTGGGRDTWKRPEMGRIADEYCETVILTNEDPYDENPRTIVEAMRSGMTKKEPEIVMDRRAAIKTALSKARTGDVVLITGKGTDPYIMGPAGIKEPWSDARVAAEELDALQS